MSFFGGGGGFGNSNTNQTAPTFGGFGNTNTSNTGFGASGGGFGAATTTPATGGFGAASGTSFGATPSAFGGGSTFGAKPATSGFGASTTGTGGLFGGATATPSAAPAFGGGFGAGGTNTAGTSSFGGGGLFGNTPKPAATGFGATTGGFGATATPSLFGGGTSTTGFGATNNPGIGTNLGDPPGTASVAFTPTSEKETSGAINLYQSLLFQEPYKKWSTEELRLADYNQGRKMGGAGGTGAFGGSGFGAATGFGASNQTPASGFGGTTGGIFGNTPGAGGFGATTGTTGGFGNTGATGGLFGAKPAAPAAGGIFGNTTTAQPATNSIFGGGGTTSGFGAANNTATTGGFGANTGTAAGGGLFGAGATPAKPATGFSFGNTGTTNSAFGGATTGTTGGFGATPAAPATGGGLFGGQQQQQQPATGGLFGGQQQQQQPATSGFGAGTSFGGATNTGGLFGNQAKPAGTFGAAAPGTGTTGGLFGNAAPAASPFGGAATAQPAASGGLFGGAKPAATGGLFGGGTTAQPAAGGGLFGGGLSLNTQTQQQPAQSGGLFGNSNNQAKPGLFGSQPATGGGLFGNSTGQANTSVFGNTLGQQQQGGGLLGNSILGATQNQQQQQPQAFSTSINDLSAYGSSTLFNNLSDDKITNPGPLATPLSGKAKVKSRSILPMYKLSPANASRFNTPQKRGYGFSYSTYGSPASPASAASTPGGLGQSLLIGSIGRGQGLSKSISASNLRRSYNVEDSILSPGAFSASTGPRLLGSSSTHKKLVINRDLRTDLFTPPAKDKDTLGGKRVEKRVSFEVAKDGDTVRQSIEDSQGDDSGLLKPTTLKPAIRNNGVNGSKNTSVTATPEMTQVKGNELAIVPEEASPEQTRSSAKSASVIEPGAYWMSPTVEEIRAMNRNLRSRVTDFTVGREKVGSITFKVPVDLNTVDYENLFGNIVVLEPRSATVYPIAAKKPVMGKGLNVPALISLEHSFPRGGPTSGRRLDRHIEKLRTTIPDTTFESFDKETGVWTFSVEHFTTYGLDDDEDEDDITEGDVVSRQIVTSSATKHDLDLDSPAVDPDDTFEFKRSKRGVPGAFDEDAMTDEELDDNAHPQGMSSPDFEDVDAPVQDQDMGDDDTVEFEEDVYQQDIIEQGSQYGFEGQDAFDLAHLASNEAQLPGGIMRARMRAVKKSTAPTRIEVAGGDDWKEILQASVRAPRTVDRVALRALNESGAVWDMKDRGSPAPKKQQQVAEGPGFATSIELMNSLFGQSKGPSQPVQAPPARGFVKWPYQKRSKVDASEEEPPAPRPTWGPHETLLTTQHGEPSILHVDGSEAGSATTSKKLAQLQQYIDFISAKGDHQLTTKPSLRELAQEDPVWELANLLFDEDGLKMTEFWKQIVSGATDAALLNAETPEEKAIICLAGNRVADACGHLIEAQDFRLASLVASIGTGTQTKDIRQQLNDWRDSNVLSEFSEPIRALYELLGGNACVCAGVKNVPIENRVASFTISQRFGLDWMQAFGLRLFYVSKEEARTGEAGWDTRIVEAAVRSFEEDIEQDREPEPDHPLWSILKIFAFRQFDWSDPRLGWLLTKAIHATGKVSFGGDAAEKLDMSSLKFAAALTSLSAAEESSSASSKKKNLWVQAAFVLGHLSDPASKESAVRDHLGRHAHLIGNPKDEASPFAAMRKFGVPEPWIWEAKALHFRVKEDARQEFLALVWAGNYREANRAFVGRVAPELVIRRDFEKLFRFAELLFKVRRVEGSGGAGEWERGGAGVYLLYPLAVQQQGGSGNGKEGLLGGDEVLVNQLLDGLVALRAQTHGDVKQEAAIADMAESLIRGYQGGGRNAGGNDQRLYGLLPEDVRGKYLRARALESVC